MQTAKTDQTGWTESLLGTKVILLVLSCGGSSDLSVQFPNLKAIKYETKMFLRTVD